MRSILDSLMSDSNNFHLLSIRFYNYFISFSRMKVVVLGLERNWKVLEEGSVSICKCSIRRFYFPDLRNKGD